MERYELVYKIDHKNDILRLFGSEFFFRNKNFGNFIYKNKRYKLIEKIETKNIKEKEIILNLFFYKIIYDKSCMFKDCETLIKVSIPDKEDKFNSTEFLNIPEEEGILFDFYYNNNSSENSLYKTINNIESISECSECSECSEILKNSEKDSDFSVYKENYYNLKFISNKEDKLYLLTAMFHNCKSLISLPDISKWNINKVSDLSGVFYNCKSLISLPDISKWNIKNVTHLSLMFYNCSSLIFLPDISKWNTYNVEYMNQLFANCSSLKSLPDISKWDVRNVVDISKIFFNCSSILNFPDISKWNTNNLKHINSLFENCSSLLSAPDISKWRTYSVEIFYIDRSVYRFNIRPRDILYRKYTYNIRDISSIFANCSSLKSLPDISN